MDVSVPARSSSRAKDLSGGDGSPVSLTELSRNSLTESLHGLPAIHAANNALVIPLAVDYGSWSEDADRLSQAIQNYNPSVEIAQRLISISGIATPRARKELEARGFTVSDRAARTVYK